MCCSFIRADDLDCPIYDDAILLPLGFWLEGVVQCTIALLGLIGNLISAIILSRYVGESSLRLL